MAVQLTDPDATAPRRDNQPADQSGAATLAVSDGQARRLGSLSFENDGPPERQLSLPQRLALRDDIARELARLEQWSIDHGWQHAFPQLDVIVADRYRI